MKAEEYLRGAVRSGNVGHAYLFSGNDEGRKRQATEQFLQELRCSSYDILWVTPEGKEIKIGQVRSLISSLALSPHSGQWKAAVLQQAHAITQEAQSALLKLLEEPLGNAILILETGQPHALFPPVRSRLQEVSFWHFPQEAAPPKELLELREAPLAVRFAYSKRLAESPEKTRAALLSWTAYVRWRLFQRLQEHGLDPQAKRMREFLGLLEEMTGVLQRTTVAPRSVLDRIMIAF